MIKGCSSHYRCLDLYFPLQGCAYVKYVKPSSAFVALEECDEKYRAVIAEPRVPRDARPGRCIPFLLRC